MRSFLMLCIVLAASGLGLTLAGREPVRREAISWQSPAGDLVQATLHLPEARGRYPTVMLCYSIYQERELAEDLAASLAANGVGAATVILEAYSPNLRRDKQFDEYARELEAGLKTLRHHQEVDTVFLFGHSMGADLACNVASRDQTVRATLAAGFPVDGFPDTPANLLLAVGVWDQLHPLSEMRRALAQATGLPDAREGTTYGSFPEGTARRLLLLPLSDHAMELHDPLFLKEALAFVGQPPGVRYGTTLRMVGKGLALAGAFGLLLAGLVRFRGRGLSGLMVLTVLALGVARRTWGDQLPFHLAILCLVAATAVANGIPSLAGWKRCALYVGALWLTLMATCLLIGYEAVLAHPIYLFWLPVFALYAVPMSITVTAAQVSNFLFHQQSGTTGIHPILAGVLVLELLWPGGAVRSLLGVLQKLVTAVQNANLKIEGKVSPAQIALLLVLMAAGAIAWRQTLGGGYLLDASELLRLLFLLARLILFPAIMMALLLRTRFFRNPC